MSIVEFLSSLAKEDIRLWLEGDNLRYSAPEGKFTAEIRSRIVAQKTQIVDFLKQAQVKTTAAIPRAERSQPIRASYGQQRLWVVDKINPGDVTYNISAAFLLTGDLDSARLEQAFRKVIDRHEILRSVFQDREGEPYLDVRLSAVDWALAINDLSSLPEPAEADAIKEHLAQESLASFDLANGPLLRARILKLAPRDGRPRQVMIVGMHHIVSDAWSMEVLVKEVITFYMAGSAVSGLLPALDIQYADYAAWQRNHLDEGAMKPHVDYWVEHLRGAPPVLKLPTDFARSDIFTTHGATLQFPFPDALAQQVETTCKRHDLTPFMLTLAAWQFLLSRYADVSDIVLGIPVAGRDAQETQPLIGYFVNLLLLRQQLNTEQSIQSFLKEVRNNVLAAFNHQQVPTDLLFEHIAVERQPGYPPLAQAAFQLLNADSNPSTSGMPNGGLSIEPLPLLNVSSRMDVTLGIAKNGADYSGSLEYNTSLFKASTMETMARHYLRVLQALTSDASQLLANIELVSHDELCSALGVTPDVQLVGLNANQTSMVLDEITHPDTCQNAYGITCDLPADMNLALLSQSLQDITNATPMLRVMVKHCDLAGTAPYWLVVLPGVQIQLKEHNLGEVSDREYRDYIDRLMHRRYDIFSETLANFHWVNASDERATLVLGYHHIALDGASTFAHLGNVLKRYEALRANKTAPVVADTDYARYLDVDKTTIDSPETLAFWRQQLAAAEPLEVAVTVEVALNGAAPENFSPVKTALGDVVKRLQVPATLMNAVKAYCSQQALSLPVFFKGIYGLLLKHYCRADASFAIFDFYGNRNHVSQDAIGCFYLQHPFVFDISSRQQESIASYFASIKQKGQEIRAYKAISLRAQYQMMPLAQAIFMFNFYNFSANSEVHGQPVVPHMSAPKVDRGVQFIVEVMPEVVTLELRYDTGVFCDQGACDSQGLLERALQLAEQISRPETSEAAPLYSLNYLTTHEQQMLTQWGQGRPTAPVADTVVTLFERQVETTPDAIALIEDEYKITYRELNSRVNRIANALIAKGVGKGVPVALLFDRSLEWVVGVLAAVKSGGIYVPLDASYPEDRLRFIVSDAGARVVLTASTWSDQARAIADDVMVIDHQNTFASSPDSNPPSLPAGNDILYLIYTSGSTGTPKGASVYHAAEVNLQQWYCTTLGMSGADRFLVISAVGFDLTQKNLFAPLISGGCIVIPRMDVYDDATILDTIEKHRITVVNGAPSAFYPVVELAKARQFEPLASLRFVVLGGEPIQLKQLYAWLASSRSKARLVNSYGPTECTDVVAFHVLDQIDGAEIKIPLGIPVDNCELHILNEAMQPVIPGCAGELCIGGVALGAGYWNKPDLTAAAFVTHPQTGERLYKTGDLVRYLSSGELDYIGRKDFQVKLRGLRIELGEIENRLRTLSGVKDALVLVRDERLLGYVVMEDATLPIDWREQLRHHLPQYMVPSACLALPRWPLTPNGKVDRKALPNLDDQTATIYIAPRNAMETGLAAIWGEVLDRHSIGIRDNLFDVGGNSLIATRILSRVRRQFEVDVSVRDLFRAPTIEGLARLVERAKRAVRVPAFTKQRRPAQLPLSFAQQRLWIIDLVTPESAAYNMPAAIKMQGHFDLKVLERAVQELARRHEVFRTRFLTVEDEAVQVIEAESAIKVTYTDLSTRSAEQAEKEIRELVTKASAQPFNLAAGHLLRVNVYAIDDRTHVLFVNMHHIISDGWSIGVAVREIVTLYNAYLHGRKSPLPELETQYADYALWQRGWLKGDELERQLDFWKDYLAAVPVLELPTDFIRPPTQSYRGGLVKFSLESEALARLNAFSQQAGVTLFMTLLSAFNVLLHRYSSQSDIAVGIPHANRDMPELESMIGFFVNTLTIRTQWQDNPRFSELVEQVRDNTLRVFDHVDVPFEKVVDHLQVPRDMSHTPLFQVMFVMQNTPQDANATLENLTISLVNFEAVTAKFDLTLSVAEVDGALQGAFEYASDLFKEATVAAMSEHFCQLLRAFANDPSLSVGNVNMLCAQEHQQLLEAWNATERPFDKRTVVDQFEAQTSATPLNIAVIDQHGSLDYQTLNQKANQWARYFAQRGVTAGDLVALCLSRNNDFLVAVLATLKLGAAYVPLDTQYPKDRLEYIVSDAKARLLVIADEVKDKFSDTPASTAIELATRVAQEAAKESVENLGNTISPDAYIYVIYTSGSTGRPKGTAAYHHSESNLMGWYTREFDMQPSDRVIVISAIGFDLTQKNLFAPLMKGATVVLPAGGAFDVDAIASCIEQHGVTWLNCAPSAFYALIDQAGESPALATLRNVFLGGEPILLDRLTSWMATSSCQVINSYGPTECTDIASWHVIDRHSDYPEANIPIGRAIDNVEIYVLDARQQLVPVGVPGELCIGGVGVGPGYFNDEKQTAEKFLPHPFKPDGGKIYRTGDQVRFLANGDIQYIGRFDNQVKIRGYRIELGEIENAIRKLPEVKACAVIAREDQPGKKFLAAYIVFHAEPIGNSVLRSHLKSALPEFMVPVTYTTMERLPLTPNGKVDTKGLPAPVIEADQEAYTAPHSPTQETLCTIWCSVLGRDRIGIHDNFFELGGDSILGIQIISRAKKQGLHISPKDIFQCQTISELAEIVDSHGDTHIQTISEQGLLAGDVPLLPIQRWFIEQNYDEYWHYNQSLMLSLPGEISTDAIRGVFAALLKQHDALRLAFQPSEHGWQQYYSDNVDVALNEIDLRKVDDASLSEVISRHANEAQRTLRPAVGQQMSLLLMRTRLSSRLLIVVHHMAIDGISWRILLDDLRSAMAQYALNPPQSGLSLPEIALGEKSTSFRQWSQCVADATAQGRYDSEWDYWQKVCSQGTKLAQDNPDAENLFADENSVSVSLDEATTRLLLQSASQAYNTEINDLLLAALGSAIARHTEKDNVVLTLEGHGREWLDETTDISRTVGWFTIKYPVALNTHARSIGAYIKAVKEDLRAIPSKGMGYYALRYRNEVPDSSLANPSQVIFNYLGQLDALASGQSNADGGIGFANEPRGTERCPGGRRDHLLDVNGIVAGGKLSVDWIYSDKQFKRETIEAIANDFITSLQDIVTHCTSGAKGYTPSDFPLCGLSQMSLDTLLQGRDDVEDLYPMTPTQAGMLFHSLYTPDSSVYFEQVSADINGDFDSEQFTRAWQFVSGRHAMLRTAFLHEDLDQPLQCVQKTARFTVENIDWSALSESEKARALENHLLNDRKRGYDFGSPGGFRLTLFKFSETRHRFLWSYHHMVLDGWSLPVVLGEIFQTYEALRQDATPALGRPSHYADYIRFIQQQDVTAQRDYWMQYLKGFNRAVPLAIKRNVPDAKFVGAETIDIKRLLEAETVAQLNHLAREQHVTLNTLLQCAWAVCLAKYSQESDILFGATTSGRPPQINGVETMVGLFINTLPVRIGIDSHEAFISLAKRIQSQQLEQRAFEFSSLAQVRAWSEVPRDQTLFDSIFVFENFPITDALKNRDNTASFEVSDVRAFEQTNFPLTVLVSPGEALHVKFAYDPAWFSGDAISSMSEHYCQLLRTFATEPTLMVGEADLLGASERHQVLVEWNATQRPFDIRTVIDQFEEQAASTPHNTAVIDEQGSLDYRTLNQKANQWARYFQRCGVKSGDLVALCMSRNSDFLVSVLATLKLGAAYVPLDTQYPKDRLDYIVSDANARLLVISEEVKDKFADATALTSTVLATKIASDAATESTENLGVTVSPDGYIYVIYTSGSTGRPKGTAAYHRSESNLMGWYTREFDMQPNDRVIVISAIGFDLTQKNLFAPLLKGAAVVLPAGGAFDVDAIATCIAQHGVSWLNCAPSAFYALIDQASESNALATLRNVFLGGEPIALNRLKSWMTANPCRVINSYGPTECTDIASWHVLDRNCDYPEGNVPIGRAIDNVEIYVLDERRMPVPVGVPGELCIGGVGVGPGYFNDPTQTADKFLPHPFNTDGGKIYRTGDQVRYLSNGDIQYIGRIDNQVKIRGYRIELGEIETALLQIEGIKEAAVVARRPDNDTTAHLVGFVTVTSDASGDLVSEEALKQRLGVALPNFMVPTRIVTLEKMPLTPNGKIDRRGLPETELVSLHDSEYIAPRNPLEEIIQSVWEDVLGLSQISIHQSFFDAGGHSLNATQVVSRLRKRCNVRIELRDLFEAPSIAQLAARLDPRTARQHSRPPMVATERTDLMALSYGQQRLWLLHQIDTGSPAYHMPSGLKVQGPLNIGVLQQVLTTLIARHESLRTVFVEKEGAAWQRILSKDDAAVSVSNVFHVIDMVGKDIASAREQMLKAFNTPFNLETGPLLRVVLIKIAENEHWLLTTMHHVISDGWSMSILNREVITQYLAATQGITTDVSAPRFQYVDYAAWQRQWLQGSVLEDQLAFWKEYLKGVSPLQLPVDYIRPPVQTYAGNQLNFTLEPEVVKGVHQLSQALGATPFMVLLAAFKCLLHRYSSQTDITVGIPHANRDNEDLEDIIGFFVNTLTLRSQWEDEISFAELVKIVRESSLQAFEHVDVPFEKVVEHLNVPRDMSHSPLFQVMFILQNTPRSESVAINDLRISPMEPENVTSKFDLTLTLEEQQGVMIGSFEYATDLFKAATVDAMIGHFQRLLKEVIADPQQRIGSIPLLLRAEMQKILVEWNSTGVEYNHQITLGEAVRQQAIKTPSRTALVATDQTLSFAELESLSNQWANHLRVQNVKPGDFIGVCCERNADLVVALLAVLKCGCAYVPIDPEYPRSRIEYVIQDAKPSIILTHERLVDLLPTHDTLVLPMDKLASTVAQQSTQFAIGEIDSSALAYVIYTSGSTGNPKGVQIQHRAFMNFITGMHNDIGINDDDRLLAVTSLSFDIAGLEIFMPLLFGARVVLATREQAMDVSLLADTLDRQEITFLQATPATWHMLVNRDWRPSGKFKGLCGGEPMPPVMANQLLERGIALFNVYGPTETTVWSTVYAVKEAVKNGVPIGRPISNTLIYVLDRNFAPVPVGVPGELFIGGDGVAAGYLNRPDLTEERFIDNPFLPAGSGKIYRTGDLVRYLDNGVLECLGRLDHQVKIRGHRIELGEIEAILNRIETIKEAVVHPQTDASGVKFLAAYFVALDDNVNGVILREYLKTVLPDYMVPTAYVPLEAMPLTPNGKVDRKALPAPAEFLSVGTEYVAPSTQYEIELAAIWEEVLHREKIGIKDDFFNLGGHSLLATQIVARVKERYQIEFPLRVLFEMTTLEAMAKYIDTAVWSRQSVANGAQDSGGEDYEEIEI